MNLQNECDRFIESILGCTTDLTTDEVIEVLSDLLSSFSLSNEKKKCEIVKKLMDELKFIRGNNVEIYRQNKEKMLYSNIKLDNKTRYLNTVSNDNLSPTMYAYYFCQKNRQILSDKEAAALKAMNIENNFEVMKEDNNLKFGRGANDFDQLSNHSNNSNQQLSLYDSSLMDKNDKIEKSYNYDKTEKIPQIHLKMKRKATDLSTGKVFKGKKVPRNQRRANPYDDPDDNREDNDSKEEEKEKEKGKEKEEWCISNCLFATKKKKDADNIDESDEWIACDSCNKWYHPKCLNITKDEFQLYQKIDWYCADCKNKGRI